MKTLKVLLADDHEVVRRGLRAVLAERREWTVCGEATTGRQAVELSRALRPDVVIMDLTMPELNGLDATRQIRAALPQTEVLMLTMHASEELLPEILAAGARGFVLKSDAGKSLIAAVKALARHELFVTERVARLQIADAHTPGRRAKETFRSLLTPREREIVQLVAEGKSTKELAGQLGISVKTAETHRSNIMRKLDLRSVSDIVRYAIRNRIAEP